MLSAMQNMNRLSFPNATGDLKVKWLTVVLLTLNLLFRPVFILHIVTMLFSKIIILFLHSV